MLSEPQPDDDDPHEPDATHEPYESPKSQPDSAILAGTLRAPWKWEALLVESAVIGGSDRWTRRLNGLAESIACRSPS